MEPSHVDRVLSVLSGVLEREEVAKQLS